MTVLFQLDRHSCFNEQGLYWGQIDFGQSVVYLLLFLRPDRESVDSASPFKIIVSSKTECNSLNIQQRARLWRINVH